MGRGASRKGFSPSTACAPRSNLKEAHVLSPRCRARFSALESLRGGECRRLPKVTAYA